MRAARWSRHRPGVEPQRGLPDRVRERRLEQRRVDVLAGSAPCALVQRREDAERCERAGVQIGKRHAGHHRRAARLACEAHDAGHRLRHQIEAGTVGVRTRPAEAGDRARDEAGIAAAQRGGADTEPIERAGPIVLDEHIRALGESGENGGATGIAQIEREAALAVIHRIMGSELTARALLALAQIVPAAGPLDLQHIGAHLREQQAAVGAGHHVRHVEDHDAGQRPRCFGDLRRLVIVHAGTLIRSRPVAYDTDSRRRRRPWADGFAPRETERSAGCSSISRSGATRSRSRCGSSCRGPSRHSQPILACASSACGAPAATPSSPARTSRSSSSSGRRRAPSPATEDSRHWASARSQTSRSRCWRASRGPASAAGSSSRYKRDFCPRMPFMATLGWARGPTRGPTGAESRRLPALRAARRERPLVALRR